MLIALITFLVSTFQFSFTSYSCSQKMARNNQCKSLIKLNMDSGLGKCLPNHTPKDISLLFKQNKIEVYLGNNPKIRGKAKDLKKFNNFSDPRVVAVARIIEAINKIGNGTTKSISTQPNIQIVFSNTKSNATNSRRIANQIQLAGGNQNNIGTDFKSLFAGQDNYGLIAHEIAHYFAGADKEKVFQNYIKALNGKHCQLTSYSHQNRKEEFAEIFAAYITMPQAFTQFVSKAQQKVCTQAFKFMKELFGEKEMTPTCQARKTSYN